MSKQVKNKNGQISRPNSSQLDSSKDVVFLDPLDKGDPKSKDGKKGSDSKVLLIAYAFIPLQILLFLFIFVWGYRNQYLSPSVQETIQSSSFVDLFGPQEIDLGKGEGDPRLDWFDPGATVIYEGFVDEVNNEMIYLADSDLESYEIPLSEKKSITCQKALRSACPCLDDCELSDVSNSIVVSVHNYYESVDLQDGGVEDKLLFTRIFIE